MKRHILFFAALFFATYAANAGTIYLNAPPLQGWFPASFTPYTFVTGFSIDGTAVEGTCGYYAVYNQHAWFKCTWDLTGVATLGEQVCCNVYGEHAPKPVYGTYANYAGDTTGTRTPANGGRSWLTTP
jgi:hypothetical protein